MFYRLEGHAPVACKDAREWAEWMETADRTVAVDTIDDFTISTVFVGIDPNTTDGPAPLLFETLVFRGDKSADNRSLYSSWEDAIQGHRAMVADYRRRSMRAV